MRRKQPQTTRNKGYPYPRVIVLAMLLLVMLLAVSFHYSTRVQAAGLGPIIHWNSSMIYGGQNNGYPWGPVGENALVNGSNFTPNLQLRLVLVQGDSNANPAICRSAGVTVGTVMTNGSGTFQQGFTWPVAAGQVNGQYSICSQASDGAVRSHQDDGPFTVLAANPPVISISPTSVTAGTPVTITGQNWVPPQAVTINISGGSSASVTANSNGLNAGTFSISYTFPTNATPSNYSFSASTGNKLLLSGAREVNVTVPPTATPTATPSPTATPTATPTDTATATPDSTATDVPTATTTVTSNGNTDTGSSNSSGGGGNPGLLIGMIVAIVLILLALAALVFFGLRQRAMARRAEQNMPSNTYGGSQGVMNYGPYGQADDMHLGNSSPGYGYSGPADNFGQPWQPSASASGFAYPMQSNSPANTYDQTLQLGSSSPVNDQPTHFNSQGVMNYGPYNGQPVPQNGYSAMGTNAAVCMNCGRPLGPQDVRCNTCGMPVGAQNSDDKFTRPNWGR